MAACTKARVFWLHVWLAATLVLNFAGSSIHAQSTPDATAQSASADDEPLRLAYVDRLLVRLPKDYEPPLTTRWTNDNRLLLEVEGQPPRLIGAKVDWTYKDGERRIVSPLAQLSADQMRGLWGIELSHWSDEIGERLRQIDFQGTCVTLGEDAVVQPDDSFPPLPKDLRCLRIEIASSPGGFSSYERLRTLQKLRFFQRSGLSNTEFDAALLAGSAEHLEVLDLSSTRLENLAGLSRLKNLRTLSLRNCKTVTDVSFVRGMKQLETLNISRTMVTDLAPLAPLAAITHVIADAAPVARLPQSPLPSLRELRVQHTQLADADVSSFSELNSNCVVMHRLRDSLVDALQDVTRLRIRSGGTCHRQPQREETLFETDDVDAIKELIAGIHVDEEGSGFHCMCCGEPTFEFYSGDELTVVLGFHHGQSMRWPGGWPSDASLTRQSASFLINWLAKGGVDGPLKALQERRDRERAAERKRERVLAGMSAELRQAFFDDAATPRSFAEVLAAARGEKSEGADGSAFAKQLRKELPRPENQAAVLLKMLGATNDSWTMYDGSEQRAQQLLVGYEADALQRATGSALLGEDRQLKRGAARFWQASRSPLDGWRPEKAAELHVAVLDVLRESRYYPLRQMGMDRLAQWGSELTAEEFARRIDAGLHDPHTSVRRNAMLAAGRFGHQASAAHLTKVLAGEEIELRPLPQVPAPERVDVGEGFDDVAGKRPEDEVAALALGYLRHEASRANITSRGDQSPMFAVALALLGDAKHLRAEHFRLKERNTELQLAAVEAVVRCRGRYGLKWAVDYEQSTAWWEDSYVARRLSAMLCAEQAPGSEALVDCDELETVAEWYEQFGEQYLEQVGD